LGNLSTRYPITFINRVVGATCTIIANLYREEKLPIEKGIASILLCGILADTLSLQSATTTEIDREAAEYLSSITGLDIQALSRDMIAAASQIDALSAQEIIGMDMKNYTEQGLSFTVSQVETDHLNTLADRTDEIVAALEKARSDKEHFFAALLVTDITVLDSLLFVSGEKAFTNNINFPAIAPEVYKLKGVVSRKKQLIPILSELIEKKVAENA
jgi:manganese-dependent inorganic pyrophosphatase